MEKKIAEERIRRLFEAADSRVGEDNLELSHRYVELAREIGMSYNVSIPGELKEKICGGCSSYLVPGKNSRVRIDSRDKVFKYTCGSCGEVNRYEL